VEKDSHHYDAPRQKRAIDNAQAKILYIWPLSIIPMHTLRRLRFALVARFIAVLAVLCLLGMQQGAAFHALSHLADDNSTGTQKHLPHSNTCDKCIVYGEVSGAGPTTTHAAFRIPSQFIVIASAALQPFPFLALPVYSARAPPISL